MRVMLLDFVQSDATISKVASIAKELDLNVICWTARARFAEAIKHHAPSVRFEAYPAPHTELSTHAPANIWTIAEPTTLLFLQERERVSSTAMNDVLDIEIAYRHACASLDCNQPDVIFYSDVPHNIYSYCLYVEAKRRGIKQRFIKRTPLPHLIVIAEDVDRGVRHAMELGTETLHSGDITDRLLAKMRSEYEEAETGYMKAQKSQDGWQAYAKKAAGSVFKYARGGRIVHSGVAIAARRRLRVVYNKLVTDVDRSHPYVVLFLHLQPERSSVPEGGRFAQQWLIAKALSEHLPESYQILVREHPSTFRPSPKLVRTKEDYERFLDIPRVRLASTDGSPFDLIDGAAATATITGTVGFEGLCRGVPSLLFGAASYLDCEGAFDCRTTEGLVEAVQQLNNAYKVSREAPQRYAATLASSPLVFVAGAEAVDDYMDYHYSGDLQSTMLRQMVETLHIKA